MARYKVGVGSDAWNFDAAYQAAQNGDTLEFEQDYWYVLQEGQEFQVCKNLNFVGQCVPKEQGGFIFSTGIKGKFVIQQGATVSFQQLWFTPLSTGAAIYVKDKSTVNLSTVVLDNSHPDNKHFVIFAEQESTVNAIDLEIKDTDKKNQEGIKCVGKSTLSIKDSLNLNGKIIMDQSTLKLDNCCVTVNRSNALNIQNDSMATLEGSTITSLAPQDMSFPAIWLDNSQLNSNNSQVIQEGLISSVTLKNRSIYDGTNDNVPSMSLYDSTAYLTNTTVQYGLYSNDRSHIVGRQTITIKGIWNEKIDLFLSPQSSFIADRLELSRIASPNIRLDQSFAYVKELAFPGGDVTQISVEEKNGGQFVRQAHASPTEEVSGAVEEKDALEELQQLIGLPQVKRSVEMMVNQVAANKKRVAKGLKPLTQTLHAVFMGNPGTGKTTVARLLGKVLFQQGALSGKEFKFVEVSEPDLISQNVGGTALQTKSCLDAALGGVLFIDEAYTLNKKGATINHGQEAIDTIMKYMEDHRDEIMVIFAGYTKEMEQFLKTNPGLASRAPNRFIFEDYTDKEIVQLGELLLEKDQLLLEDKAYYEKKVAKAYAHSLDNSNGRWIRNFNEALTKEQLNRVVKTASDDVETILNEDIDQVINQGRFKATGQEEDALERLGQLIGIQTVKRQVQEFIYQVEANQKKEEMGMRVSDFTLHSLFLGNPGTGKTTVARIIGKVLYQKGLIASDKFIEVSRSDLVAGYVGQTGPKTREVLDAALGGVLFIDEAYSLNGNSDNDFGKEAIDEILKFMEDHRRDIVIIFAGYTKEMGEFLQMNSGLVSRIPTTFNFEDYTPDELVQIGLLGLTQYRLDEAFYAEKVKAAYAASNDQSNGRWVRNFNEKLLRVQSARLIQTGQDDFDSITNEDMEQVKE